MGENKIKYKEIDEKVFKDLFKDLFKDYVNPIQYLGGNLYQITVGPYSCITNTMGVDAFEETLKRKIHNYITDSFDDKVR